jgi:prolyl-tRNA editing enzyme YbaK/EbsC (Cys-tRNA(Pro) deacylase)
MGDAATVLHLTGFAVGGVPPIGHASPLAVLMDASLDRFQLLYAAAGTGTTVFPVTPRELKRITQADVVDVAR